MKSNVECNLSDVHMNNMPVMFVLFVLFVGQMVFSDEKLVKLAENQETKKTQDDRFNDLRKEIFDENFFKEDTSASYSSNAKRIDQKIEEFSQIAYGIAKAHIESLYPKIRYSSTKEEKSQIVELRLRMSVDVLEYRKTILENIDNNFDYNVKVYRNVGTRYVDSGILPETIQNSAHRKEYESVLRRNDINSCRMRLQDMLLDIDTKLRRCLTEFIIETYAVAPRADDELVGLLNKYEYPEKEKVQIFKALNIPYKGFREWQTNDDLFKLTAKMISADKKEVKLEKEDGKRTSIELSALRKEDQDYVKRQLESETKKLLEEKPKK